MTNWITQDRIKVKVSSIDGTWTGISVLEAEREVQSRRPGAGEEKVTIATGMNLSDVTITRLFNADTDVDLVKRLYKGALAGSTITVTYLDEDGNAIPGKSIVHTGCAVKSFAEPEGDSDGSDVGVLSITWTRTGVK
jgi:hypothetical protein